MYYVDRVREENLESNYFKSGGGDEDDETAADWLLISPAGLPMSPK